jgi:hypothetical protein
VANNIDQIRNIKVTKNQTLFETFFATDEFILVGAENELLCLHVNDRRQPKN